MTTRLSQSLFVEGDINLTGNLEVPGNLLVGGYMGTPPAPDSLMRCEGTFSTVTGSRSKTLADVDNIDRFKVGDRVRIYGASSGDPTLVNNLPSTVTRVSLSTPVPGSTQTLYYQIAEFDLRTGNIAPALASQSIGIGFDLDEFNTDQFVKFSFTTPVPANRGLLIYRRISLTGNWRLAHVLGTKDFAQPFIDYYTFDYNDWQGKRLEDNTYPDDVIHFTHTPPTSSRLGWVDAEVESVFSNSNTLVLTELLTVDVNNLTVNVAQDDTVALQGAIESVADIDKNQLNLSDKVYNITSLNLPSEFAITGEGGLSVLRKLPWSGYSQNSYHNNFFKISQTDPLQRLILRGVSLDGNAIHQVLFADSTDVTVNQAVPFVIAKSNRCILDNSVIRNVVGGGIYAPESSEFRIINSTIRDSGVTDRYSYAPVVFSASEDLQISSSNFKNFSDSVDCSLVNKGTVTNNIIDNCGSGLYVFGSRYLISSPNILLGPAGEYFSYPDILNSEYDSVNIYLVPDAPTLSPVFKYQENGEIFNLAQNARNRIIYQTWLLEKTTNGIENLYQEITAQVPISDRVGFDRTQGEFAFTVTRTAGITIRNTYNYETLREARPSHRGIVFTASLEEWVESGVITSTSSGGSPVAGIVDSDEYIVTVSNPKYIYVGAEVAILDQVGFSVTGTTIVGTITEILGTNASSRVRIRFPGQTITAGTDVGSLGTLNIVNKFILAKGQIL
jgi:hypothetical protein